MSAQEGFGGCLWVFVGVMFFVGLFTLPFGVIIWIALAIWLRNGLK